MIQYKYGKEVDGKMEFRDLKRQYEKLKPELDWAIEESCRRADFIHGSEVITLEEKLADYVGVKHCITLSLIHI